MTAPRNLVYFQSDNHNRSYLGCYGHGLARTPVLDRIAGRGVRFANAYAASALCCPARASLATGRYPHQTGYWDNAIVYDGRVPSWMHRLRGQGHHVASVGKLHYRSSEDDNGFSEELLPMHILGAKGGVSMLLRAIDGEPENLGQWQLYLEKSGVGETQYQDFDRKISDRAIRWLREDGRGRGRDRDRDRPWVLHVSYVSPHPPFLVPKRLLELFPPDQIDLPPLSSPEARPDHPALRHLRRVMAWGDLRPEDLRRIGAGYLALIAHLDEQVGRVMAALEDLGLLETTRVLYTSDHGEMAGSHGLLGKCNLYEGAIGVPLLIAGPEVPAGRVVTENVSHVDLFPTLVKGAGGQLLDQDADLPGRSLWPAVAGDDRARGVFAEYHAAGSRAGAFMVRDGHMKLIYYVNLPPQLFCLLNDPQETRDLAPDPDQRDTLARLEGLLRAICDPEAVDRRAKADQRAKMDHWGGAEAIKAEGMLVYTPPPGADPDIQGRTGETSG